MFRSLRTKWVFPFLFGTLLLSAGVWAVAWRTTLTPLAEQADSELALAADQLTRHLFRYRELAVVLAEHPVLKTRLADPAAPTSDPTQLLQSMADMTGARYLALVDREGRILAASHDGGAKMDASTPYIYRALTGALGGHAQFTQDGRREFSFAAPVLVDGSDARGALIARTDLLDFEENWPSTSAALFFTADDTRVFVANRLDLVGQSRDGAAFLDSTSSDWSGHEVWSLKAGRYLPDRALHLARDLPAVGLTGEILLDTAPAERISGLLSAVAAAICLGVGALFLALSERRRAYSERLQIEAAANARLEARVKERTQALSAANEDLQRENRERREAEAALKKAQDDLVQAGKLSALGQMSAGISHELNQPLMAIRSFAENGTLLLERGQDDAAGHNLGRISELSHRMGRIIKNLRAFARQESEPITDVDLGPVVDRAIEILAPRLRDEGVDLKWQQPVTSALVRGGEVRLQHVVMNLVSNAADAMAGLEKKRIDITLDSPENTDRITLSVRDTGPGISEPDRIFDPFYSTKEVGPTEGMGLGLSISYGLVQSFGGAIRGRNHPDGGAVFTVELDRTVDRPQDDIEDPA